MQQLFRFLIFLNQPYMFRATNSTILRSTFWLHIYLLVQIHRHCCRPVPRLRWNSVPSQHQYWYIGTRYIILAEHWMWLPDDGFMWTETCWSSFYNFNYFNNLRILQFVCISWTIKCLIIIDARCNHHVQKVSFDETVSCCNEWHNQDTNGQMSVKALRRSGLDITLQSGKRWWLRKFLGRLI